MLRQHYGLNRHEFEQTLGDSRGQRSLECYSLWGLKELDLTQQLNNNNNNTEERSMAMIIIIGEGEKSNVAGIIYMQTT